MSLTYFLFPEYLTIFQSIIKNKVNSSRHSPSPQSISLGEDSTRLGRLDSPPQRINVDKESARLGLLYTPTPRDRHSKPDQRASDTYSARLAPN